ncbi:BA14K family protein [Bradyrhizobium sp. USDA 241]
MQRGAVQTTGASSPYSGTYLGYDGLRHPCP